MEKSGVQYQSHSLKSLVLQMQYFATDIRVSLNFIIVAKVYLAYIVIG